MQIDLGFALAQEIGEELGRAHANRVIRIHAELSARAIELRSLGLEARLELFGQAQVAEVRRIEQRGPVHFFFKRISIREPSLRALSRVTSGLMAAYESVSVLPDMYSARNCASFGVRCFCFGDGVGFMGS
jgi:hypothetical protein